VLSPEDAELLRRWDALLDGLRDRLSAEELEEIDEEASHDAAMGIATLLGGHEQGMHELTPEEEAELWDLAAEWECSDQDVMNDDVRAASTRNRPIPTVRPKRPLRGGGHGARSGKPGKHAFPGRWSDDEAIEHTMDVAREPSRAVKLPTGEFVAHGERDGVLLGVVVSPSGDVLTGYPVHGPGVTQNPMDDFRGPAAQRLRDLAQAVLPEDHELRALLDELHAVGEWPYVIATLRALDLPLTDEQRTELVQLWYLADLPDSTP
jgi:hypothetical protein